MMNLDILVTFTPSINMSLLQFVDLEYQLQDLLKREVDLLEKSVVEKDFNWIRRQEILNNYQVIYESQSVLLCLILINMPKTSYNLSRIWMKSVFRQI